MTDFVDVLQQGYLQRALLAGLLVGLICPTIGLYLVLRRLSLIGDGLGHVAFAGVAGGWLFGIYPLISAAVLTVVGAIGLERLRAWRRDYGDLALAIIFYTGLALGVVLTSLARNQTVNLFGLLFGSILTVAEADLWLIGGAGVLVVGAVFVLNKEFFALAYDEEIARAAGLPATLLNYLIVCLAAVTVVAAIRVVGVLLVAGMLVIPVAAGLQVARSFRSLQFVSIGFGLAAVLTGLTASYVFDIAPGGSIILAAVGFFAAAGVGRTVLQRTGASAGR